MKKLKKNSKGFTLIELLAVIVILGVLMIIAVPMVTQYITSARKDAFVDTAKAYISSARYAYLNGDYSGCTGIDTGSGGAVLIPFNQIKVDKSNGQSSFNKKIDEANSYVIIESDSKGQYTYYVLMQDDGLNGWKVPINESALKKTDVTNIGEKKTLTTPSTGATMTVVTLNADGSRKTDGQTQKFVTETTCTNDMM